MWRRHPRNVLTEMSQRGVLFLRLHLAHVTRGGVHYVLFTHLIYMNKKRVSPQRSRDAEKVVKKSTTNAAQRRTKKVHAPSKEKRAMSPRKKPGTTGEGNFFHIVIRPKEQFSSFRVQDVGAPGGLERVAGRRPSGSWDTHAWLVAKTDAMVQGGKLVLKTKGARSLLAQINGAITHVRGDIWHAHPKNVPEKDKPTEAQRTAWNKNIQKAQAARRK